MLKGVQRVFSADLLDFKLILIRLQYVFTLNKTTRLFGKTGTEMETCVDAAKIFGDFPTGLGGLSQDLASYVDVLTASNAICPRSWERKIIACYVLDGHTGLGAPVCLIGYRRSYLFFQ